MGKTWDEMTPGERNEAVARALGWVYEPRFEGDGAGYWVAPDGMHYISEDLPDFVGSLDACRLVEDAIERRGLQEQFVYELAVLCGGPRSRSVWGWQGVWRVVCAGAEQKCHAAIRALGIDL